MLEQLIGRDDLVHDAHAQRLGRVEVIAGERVAVGVLPSGEQGEEHGGVRDHAHLGLSEDGIVMFTISNRHLNLVRVLSGVLDDAGLAGLRQNHRPDKEAGRWHFRSHWVAIGRTKEALSFLSDDPRWTAIAATPDSVLWTDDFSNIVGAFR